MVQGHTFETLLTWCKDKHAKSSDYGARTHCKPLDMVQGDTCKTISYVARTYM